MTRLFLLFFLLFLLLTSACALRSAPITPPNPSTSVSFSEVSSKVPEDSPISHELWTALLQKYVTSEGLVSYKEFQKDQKSLEVYLEVLANNPPQASWSSAEQLVYWINAYNAFTIQLVLQHYPVSSIRKIGSWFQSPWKIDFISIGGKTYTLDTIEHEILRKTFKEPRIHFALNCASYSCPVLWNKALSSKHYSEELEDLARRFINDPKRNKIQKDSVEISEIFKWFQEDFVREESLISFLNRYSSVKIQETAQIQYLPYNWNLNEDSGKP
jgi:hypothetical protein